MNNFIELTFHNFNKLSVSAASIIEITAPNAVGCRIVLDQKDKEGNNVWHLVRETKEKVLRLINEQKSKP